MRSILGKSILAAAVMAAAALVSVPAHAASTLKVPFNFTAAGHDWPAGTYLVQKDDSGNVVTLKSVTTSQSLNFLLGPGEPAPTASQITLRFDASGTNRSLRSIQVGPQITSRLDSKSSGTEHLAATGR